MDLGSAEPTGAQAAGGDLAVRVADAVQAVADAVHDKAVRPVLVAARAVVFGLIAVTMALVVGVLLAIALVRVLDVYVFGGRVWASYAVIGLVLCSAGALAWRKRRPPEEDR